MTRKHVISRAEMEGVPIDPLSPTLSPETVKPPSLRAACRAGYKALWAKDPIYRARIDSLTNKAAQTGSLQQDRSMDALTLYNWVQQNQPEALKQRGEKALGWIRLVALPDLMKEFGHNRQARYEKALLLRDQRANQPTDEADEADEAA